MCYLVDVDSESPGEGDWMIMFHFTMSGGEDGEPVLVTAQLGPAMAIAMLSELELRFPEAFERQGWKKE